MRGSSGEMPIRLCCLRTQRKQHESQRGELVKMTYLSNWEFYRVNGLEAWVKYRLAGGTPANGWETKYDVRIPKRFWHKWFMPKVTPDEEIDQ